jgi:DNA-binding NarL/FixJ family response regulator
MGVTGVDGSAGLAGYSVLVLDGHELFSTVLMMALRARGCAAHRPDLTAVETVLERADRLPAGLALLDLNIGRDIEGQQDDCVASLVGVLRMRRWKVLVMTDSRDDTRIAAAISAGAAGVISKSSSLEELPRMVLAAAAGRLVMTDLARDGWLVRHRGYQAKDRQRAMRFGRLSTREQEVLTLLARGYRAGAIAEHFVVEMTTVRTQIRAVLAKLEVSSQLEAVALATHARYR